MSKHFLYPDWLCCQIQQGSCADTVQHLPGPGFDMVQEKPPQSLNWKEEVQETPAGYHYCPKSNAGVKAEKSSRSFSSWHWLLVYWVSCRIPGAQLMRTGPEQKSSGSCCVFCLFKVPPLIQREERIICEVKQTRKGELKQCRSKWPGKNDLLHHFFFLPLHRTAAEESERQRIGYLKDRAYRIAAEHNTFRPGAQRKQFSQQPWHWRLFNPLPQETWC